jgi:hypothetical protein
MRTEEEIREKIDKYKNLQKKTTDRNLYLDYRRKTKLLKWVLEDTECQK